MKTIKLPQLQLLGLKYINKVETDTAITIRSSEDVINVLRNVYDSEFISEEAYAILMTRNNKIIGIVHMGTGCATSTVMDHQKLFAIALLSRAQNIIISHSHPSGNLKPSQPDINITKKIKDCCAFHSMELLDHIILTPTSYTSFADEMIL